jgi:phosphoserine aminotransferase
MRIFNFAAGPCTLPLEVLEAARDELVDFHGAGMSLIEMSHRSAAYEEVHEGALAAARRVAAAPDDFDVLFVQGGATLQFSMVPMNLLASGGSGAHALTGAWSRKALADGRMHGNATVAWDGADIDPSRTPESAELVLASDTRYLHICSNETIGGVRYPAWPSVPVPLVVDMSSEYLSRPIPWDRVDLVYGGVQKNLGPAGMAVVYVRRSLLGHPPEVGSYLRYDQHAGADSLFNTPPVFTVWMTGKVLAWIEEQGGADWLEAMAATRAGLLYGTIDASEGFYRSPVETAHRSHANVVFRLPSPELEAAFLDAASRRGLSGLEGHRSVGGVRASIYAAMPLEGVEDLADLMTTFAGSHR